MKKLHAVIALKIFIGCMLFSLLSAVAMPKYFDLNKRSQAQQCQASQILVETALVVVYAENLVQGKAGYPEKLTAEMFADGKIPTCPIDGKPIEFDRKTGKAYCPNHLAEHARDRE